MSDSLEIGRKSINEAHADNKNEDRKDLHPGLLLAHGLSSWPSKESQSKAALIDKICRTKHSSFYQNALKRWKLIAEKNPEHFFSFTGTLLHRLYIGVTRDNALETNVTISHTYGMPLIPGSAVKGLTRSVGEYLLGQEKINPKVFQWVFGDEDDAGGLIFHDAWWECESQQEGPFVPEIITPHQSEYYRTKGQMAPSDMESPIPAPQIAVIGSFYFMIEGDPEWTMFGAKLLQLGLQSWGIGGKKSSGYGLFEPFFHDASSDLPTKQITEHWPNVTIVDYNKGSGSLSFKKTPEGNIQQIKIDDAIKFGLNENQVSSLKKNKPVTLDVIVVRESPTQVRVVQLNPPQE